MALYGPQQLAASLRMVRENTIRIAEDIPEERYGYRPTPESRSVEELLLHIVILTQAIRQMHERERIRSLEQYDFGAMSKRLPIQESDRRSKNEIVSLLKEESDGLSAWLEHAPLPVLEESVLQAGGSTSKTRFELLLGAKEHEIHHRGQLMVIERLLGIVPHLTRSRQIKSQPAHAHVTRERRER